MQNAKRIIDGLNDDQLARLLTAMQNIIIYKGRAWLRLDRAIMPPILL